MTATTDLDVTAPPGTVRRLRRGPAFLAVEWLVPGRGGAGTVLRAVNGFASDAAWDEDAEY